MMHPLFTSVLGEAILIGLFVIAVCIMMGKSPKVLPGMFGRVIIRAGLWRLARLTLRAITRR